MACEFTWHRKYRNSEKLLTLLAVMRTASTKVCPDGHCAHLGECLEMLAGGIGGRGCCLV